MVEVNEQLARRNWPNTSAVYTKSCPRPEFIRKLGYQRPLRIKAGFDPTAPDLHLGHTVLLNKMRQFQQLGHEVIFLVGDFTGLIGDPTGRNATPPPPLTAGGSASQRADLPGAGVQDPRSTKHPYRVQFALAVEHAGAGFRENRRALQPSHACSSGNDFAKRYKGGQPIAIHEFLYPLAQGYDSVALQADVEMGGTDQKFNLLVGRSLQEAFGQEPQVVMTMPLLEGTDGVNKMSKSLGNYIGVTEAPESMFGKIMSISDDLMWRYYDLLSFRSLTDIANLRLAATQGRNPRDIKLELAAEITARFHGETAAQAAQQGFMARVSDRAVPADLLPVRITVEPAGLRVANLLKAAGLAASTSDGQSQG